MLRKNSSPSKFAPLYGIGSHNESEVKQIAKESEEAITALFDSLSDHKTVIKFDMIEGKDASDLIYRLAKAKNKNALLKICELGDINDNPHPLDYVVYQKGYKYGFKTAAAQIASESKVDREALNLLLELGASSDEAVKGAVPAGNAELVNELIARGAKLKSAIQGAAQYAAQCNNFDLIAHLVNRYNKVDEHTSSLFYNLIRKNEKNALHSLILINDRLREELIESVRKQFSIFSINFTNRPKEEDLLPISLDDLLEMANKYSALCIKKQISIAQAYAWDESEIRSVMILSRYGEQLLPNSLYFIIIGYLLPENLNEINESKVEDLYHKMSLDIRKSALNMELHDYHISTSRFSWLRDKRPCKFIKSQCEEAVSEEALNESIIKEMDSMTEKEPKAKNAKDQGYFKVLEKYSAPLIKDVKQAYQPHGQEKVDSVKIKTQGKTLEKKPKRVFHSLFITRKKETNQPLHKNRVISGPHVSR
jgi:hypothetical protein